MPVILINATSSMGLVPTSVARSALVDPVRVTVIVPLCTAAAMTWLFVTTRPLDEMIIPVPWSSIPLPFTSMETTDVSTRFTNLGMLIPLGKIAAPGAFVTELIVTPPPLVVLRDAKCPAKPPTSAATKSSEMRVDQSVRVVLTCDDNGAGSTSTGRASKMGSGGDGGGAITVRTSRGDSIDDATGVGSLGTSCASSGPFDGARVSDETMALALGSLDTAATFLTAFFTGAGFFTGALVTLLLGVLGAATFATALAFFAAARGLEADAFEGTSALVAGFFFFGSGVAVVTEPC